MKKDGVWDEIETFNLEKLDFTFNSLTNNRIANLLKQYSVSTRCAYFDITESYYATNKDFFTLASPTKYLTRKYGANDVEISEQLFTSGLFIKTDNINSAIECIAKGVIKEYFESLDYEFKKSWTTAKIIENVLKTDKGKEHLMALLTKQLIVQINSDYRNDMKELNENRIKIRKLFELLCFV